MVVQILIDWDGIFKSVDMSPDSRKSGKVIRHLYLLALLIQQNGCLINSHYIETVLKNLLDRDNGKWDDRKSIIKIFQDLYRNYSIKVDQGQNALTLQDTISWWSFYISTTGVKFSRGDKRCILLSNSEDNDERFFKRVNLSSFVNNDNNVNLCSSWSKLQHFSKKDFERFNACLESFAATAKDYIRIYDPYLSEAFLPFRGNRPGKIKDWQNSFKFLMSVLLQNSNVKTIDIVTSSGKANSYDNKLEIKEVINHLLPDIVKKRKSSVNISLHFVESSLERDFHDRFLVNGRFCFAIGHGCDVCHGDSNSPNGHPQLMHFNVFYGCSSVMAPDELSGFFTEFNNNDKPKISRIYPCGYYAPSFEDKNIRNLFSMGATNTGNEIVIHCGQNDLTVRVNPQESF